MAGLKMVKVKNYNAAEYEAKAHAVFVNDSGWTWYVLKTYKSADGEAKDPYARWMCAVSSPMTHGGFDMGDTYVKDVVRGNRLVRCSAEFRAAYERKGFRWSA